MRMLGRQIDGLLRDKETYKEYFILSNPASSFILQIKGL